MAHNKRNVNELLSNIYYDLGSGAAFASPTKIKHVLTERGIHSPGIYTIRRWLQNQDNYSLQKPVRRKFKRARVLVSDPFEQADCDLADVSNIAKENDNTRYILFMIDIFSRYLWLRPLIH